MDFMTQARDWYYGRKAIFLRQLVGRYQRANFLESLAELVPEQPAEVPLTCPPVRPPSLGYLCRTYILSKIPEKYKTKRA
jgi:hypothetical protein